MGGWRDAWVPGEGRGSHVGDRGRGHPWGSQERWGVESWGTPNPGTLIVMHCATGTPIQGGGRGHPRPPQGAGAP